MSLASQLNLLATRVAVEIKAVKTDLASKGVWQSYTPTWTATVTNPDLGNGVVAGSYTRIGKTVHFRLRVKMGSTTTYGSGIYLFGLPFAAASVPTTDALSVQMLIWDNAPDGVWWPVNIPSFGSTTAVRGYLSTNFAGGIQALASFGPIAWAANDIISVSGTYEAA